MGIEMAVNYDPFSDPTVLAGFDVMRGASLGDALARANTMAYQNQVRQMQAREMQMQMDAMQRQRQFAQALPGILAQNPDMNALLSQGAAAGGDLDTLLKIAQQQRLAQQQDVTNQLLGNLLQAPSGAVAGERPMGQPSAPSAGSAMPLLAAGAITGSPQLMQLGTFMQQQQNRQEDIQREVAKEERQAKIEEAKRQREAKSLEIPGASILPDALPDATTRRSAVDVINAAPAMETAFRDMINAIRKRSKINTALNPTDVAAKEFNSANEKLNLAIKNLEQTGALDQGTIEVLRRISSVYDPTALTNIGRSNKELEAALMKEIEGASTTMRQRVNNFGYQLNKEPFANLLGKPAPSAAIPQGLTPEQELQEIERLLAQ